MAYATTTDLAEYLGVTVGELPSDAERLLDRASELVEHAMFNNYDSSITEHVEAAKKATCAQVEFWNNIGEGTAIVGRNIEGYKSGDLSMSFGKGSNSSVDKLSSRATLHLGRHGLLYRGVKNIKCDYLTLYS